MDRRDFFKGLAAASILPVIGNGGSETMAAVVRRVRPGDAAWPSEAKWAELGREVGSRLMKLEPSLSACKPASNTKECSELLENLSNPYYISDEPGYTQ